MTQEQKQLLLKDLCARLPYGVEIQVKDWAVLDTELEIGHIDRLQYDEIEPKPYLRPMSSMTEEERNEYELLANHCMCTSLSFAHLETQELIDWLNKNMFDYRCLIEKGLAIEVTKENNPYK